MVKVFSSFKFPVALIFTLCVILNTHRAFSQGSTASQCKEDCIASAEKIKKQLDDCLANAKNIKDQYVSVKTKQNCRKRYNPPSCDKLEPCPAGKQNTYQSQGPAFEMGEVEFLKGEKSFAPKQKVALRCLLKTLRRDKGNAWFHQDIVIHDTHGNIVYQDSQSLERGGEMVTSFEFNTEFAIPENFEAGTYTLKFRIREKFSRWEGEKEVQLKVTKR